MKITCIIPARGGSKRVPRKNIADLGGKPILDHCISRLSGLKLIDQIIVSTDDSEIAAVASNSGADVHIRDPSLADDFTSTDAVIADVCKSMRLPANHMVLCMYPTSVLFPLSVLEKALETAVVSKAPLMTVYESSHPIERALSIDGNRLIKMQNPNFAKARTQDFAHSYFDAGQFYICNVSSWRNDFDFLNHGAEAIILSRHEFLDIDTFDDLTLLRKLWGST